MKQDEKTAYRMAILDKIIKVSPSNKVTFVQRPE